MDIRSKQKLKKRKTRRSLDDLRKKSFNKINKNVTQNNANILKIKNIPPYTSGLIACNRLTVELFKKTVKSKTITRVPFSRIDNTDNIRDRNSKGMNDILTKTSNQYQKSHEDNIRSTIARENNHDVILESPNVKQLFNISMRESNSVTSDIPLQDRVKDLEARTSKIQYDEINSSENHLNSSSDSNSEIGLSCCSYEKFMTELPTYLRENFPMPYSSCLKETIAYIKEKCMESSYHDIENTFNCVKTSVNIFENDKKLVQNPMDLIDTSLLLGQRVHKKKSVIVSNSSSPALSDSRFKLSDIFLDSPEYQYYPHKLNQ